MKILNGTRVIMFVNIIVEIYLELITTLINHKDNKKI